MPEKSLQVTRLRLVTWKDFSGICDLEKPILALPPHRIVSIHATGRKKSIIYKVSLFYWWMKKAALIYFEFFINVMKDKIHFLTVILRFMSTPNRGS